MTSPRPRGVTCETELLAMARYARRLEATETARRLAAGEDPDVVIAARAQARAQFGVEAAMARLFGGEDRD
jgi:hypothetical protein